MSLIDQIASQLPFGKKNEGTEYFFALNISASQATAALWGLADHKLEILEQASLPYDGTEDLLQKGGATLDKAIGALEVEPQKILFGVPDSWVSEDNLKEPYLKLLRRMVKEYDLEPMAYVTTTHAISHLLQKQEGVPPTAILLGLGDFVEVALLRAGKVVESRIVKRSDHLFEDIEKALLQFTEVEVLPSKILLYPTRPEENLEKIKDDLISFPWMSKLPFLHFPKIEIVTSNIATQSVVFAGAVEVDPSVNLKHSFTVSPEITPVVAKQATVLKEALLSEEVAGAAKGHIALSRHPLSGKKGEEEGTEELGFVAGDIRQKADGEGLEGVTGKELDELGEDVLASPDVPEEPILERQRHPLGLSRRQMQGRDEEPPSLTGLVGKMPAVFSQLSRYIPSGINFKGLKLNRFGGGKIIILPILLVILALFYLFLFKAQVTVFVEPKMLEKDTEVTADPNATAVDESKKIIPAGVIETTVTGSGKGPATGSKQIGDPARGQAIIYNKTNDARNFSQGTVLTGSNNLKFTLDSSVLVASQSAVDDVGTTYGKATVSVTASVIGPDSNLSGGTKLSIAGLSADSFSAKVDQSLSGGTSKSVTVVTSDDQQKLKAQVLDSLRQQAQSDLATKLPADKKIVAEALNVADAKYSFSKQVNDQASDFSLTATVHFKGTTYSDADLKSVVSKLVGTDVPDGYTMDLSNAETMADVEKVEKDGRLVFQTKFKAKLLPKLDTDSLKKQIRGKTINQAVNILRQIENVIGAEVKVTPSLPAELVILPLLDKNITLTIAPK